VEELRLVIKDLRALSGWFLRSSWAPLLKSDTEVIGEGIEEAIENISVLDAMIGDLLKTQATLVKACVHSGLPLEQGICSKCGGLHKAKLQSPPEESAPTAQDSPPVLGKRMHGPFKCSQCGRAHSPLVVCRPVDIPLNHGE